MVVSKGKSHVAAHAQSADRGRPRHTSAYHPRIICQASLLALLISLLSPLAVRADDYPPPPPPTSPASTDDTMYPSPTAAGPSATPTLTYTDVPPEPSPQEETETSTPHVEKTPSPEESLIEPTTDPSEPTREGESDILVEKATATEKGLSEEREKETESRSTPTPDRYVRALPTMVGPPPAGSPTQTQDPVIPQELFTCSVVFLVLVTIVLGFHLVRSEQRRS